MMFTWRFTWLLIAFTQLIYGSEYRVIYAEIDFMKMTVKLSAPIPVNASAETIRQTIAADCTKCTSECPAGCRLTYIPHDRSAEICKLTEEMVKGIWYGQPQAASKDPSHPKQEAFNIPIKDDTSMLPSQQGAKPLDDPVNLLNYRTSENARDNDSKEKKRTFTHIRILSTQKTAEPVALKSTHSPFPNHSDDTFDPASPTHFGGPDDMALPTSTGGKKGGGAGTSIANFITFGQNIHKQGKNNPTYSNPEETYTNLRNCFPHQEMAEFGIIAMTTCYVVTILNTQQAYTVLSHCHTTNQPFTNNMWNQMFVFILMVLAYLLVVRRMQNLTSPHLQSATIPLSKIVLPSYRPHEKSEPQF